MGFLAVDESRGLGGMIGRGWHGVVWGAQIHVRREGVIHVQML